MDNLDKFSDTEDIPPDFFDDFNKDEFMLGLTVVDSWNDPIEEKERAKIDDELVRQSKEDCRTEERKYVDDRRSDSSNRLDEYIKPGSRRDPTKTNEAIRKDKIVKVNEYLAKRLKSHDDLKPPGTELDDFLNDSKLAEKNTEYSTKKRRLSRSKTPEASTKLSRNEFQQFKDHQKRLSPKYATAYRHNPDKVLQRTPWSPRRRSPRCGSPYNRYKRHSPRNFKRLSPQNSRRRSPRNPRRHSPYSPRRRSPQSSVRRSQHSPRRNSSRSSRRCNSQSPRRYSLHSPRRCSSRDPSPYKTLDIPKPSSTQYQSHSSSKEGFLYPENAYLPPQTDFTVDTFYSGYDAGYSYTQGPAYSDTFGYAAPLAQVATNLPLAPYNPEPVPAPLVTQTSTVFSAPVAPTPEVIPFSTYQPKNYEGVNPHDALAKLVAEGKISHEDYLKLTPNKGAGTFSVANKVDENTKSQVLKRCYHALNMLGGLFMPNQLLINKNISNHEPKSLLPKYCSPLKRQNAVEFDFTKCSVQDENIDHNKRLLNKILTLINVDNNVTQLTKKTCKQTKDVGVQTMKFCCEVCEVRKSTQFYEASTSVDLKHFTSSRHTQVLEQDLINSRTVFTPSGGISDGAPISIAHLTPAQLVSQLAARAKTLKQNPNSPLQSTEFTRRPSNNYDFSGDARGHYQNKYDYPY